MPSRVIKHCNDEITEWQWSSPDPRMPNPFWTSCFLIDGLLIDSGPPAGVKALKKFLLSLSEEEKVEKCVITHSHEDHSGGARMVKEEIKIPIFASELALPLLQEEESYPDYRQMTWGIKRDAVVAEPLVGPIRTKNDKYEFHILPMPGHAPELFALIEKEQEWAIVTDAVMPKYKLMFGRKSSIQEDVSQIHDSMKKLHEYTKGMNNLLLFTAGRGVFEGRDYLLEKMREIESLRDKAHELYQELSKQDLKDRSIIRKIVRHLFKKEGMVGQLTRGDLSSYNLVLSLIKWKS